MFGDDDAFLNTIVKLLRRLPAYPLFGQGLARLQPVFVEDVAEAIARALNPKAPNTCELGGPKVYTYRELLAERQPHGLGNAPSWALCRSPYGNLLGVDPRAPISRNQIELMEADTVASPEVPGFDAFGIAPQPIAHTLEKIIVAA